MWTVRCLWPSLGLGHGLGHGGGRHHRHGELGSDHGLVFFLLFGLDSFAESTFWVTLVGVVFLVIMTIITALGIELAAEIQWGLLGIEFVILVVFSVVALIKVYGGGIADSVKPQWEWFSPFGMSGSTLAGGVLLALLHLLGVGHGGLSERRDASRRPACPGWPR